MGHRWKRAELDVGKDAVCLHPWLKRAVVYTDRGANAGKQIAILLYSVNGSMYGAVRKCA
jgi:hypothetical protein